MDIFPLHPKYGYNTFEQVLMVIVTGITNFAGIPACILLFKSRLQFQAHIGWFTVATSFLYHALESVDGVLFLNEGQWHRLDNIGAITGFMMLFIHLMDNNNPVLDLNLNMIALFIAIVAQEKDPWDLFYTLVPICSYLILFLLVLTFRKRKPVINTRMLGKATFWLVLASIFFAFGLNEYKDYLRISHGLWHMCLGISSLYFWQIKIRPGEEFTFSNLWSKKYNPRILIWEKSI